MPQINTHPAPTIRVHVRSRSLSLPRLHFRAILLFTVLQTMDKAGNSSIVPDRSLAAEDALQEDSSEVA